MTFRLEAKRSVLRDRERLPKEVQRRIADKLELLMQDPIRPRPGLDLRPLGGARKGEWRLRVGEYRVTYEVVGNTITILEIGHRSNYY